MKALAKVVLGLAAIIVGAGGVYLLSEATMSTHYETGPDSEMVVVVRAASNRAEPGLTLDQMARAQIDTCALEVSRGEGDVDIAPGPGDRFVVTLRPSLDSTDRKQYRGCLQDWAVDHLQLHVDSMTTDVGSPGGVGGS